MAGPFELKLREFAAKAEGRADAAVREVVLEIGRRLIVRSPVDTGRFRSNWFYDLDGFSREATDATGAEAVQSIGAMPLKAAGHVHTIVNNLPYAWRLEYGWSKQAPLGMVALTAIEFRGIVDGAAAKAAGMNSISVLGSDE